MGQSADAALMYGILLGCPQYDELNLETNDEGELPNDYEFYEIDWDDLIEEFVGFTEPRAHWGERGTPEHDAWTQWMERRKVALDSAGVTYGSYGYEYDGVYLAVRSSVRTSYWTKAIETLPNEITDEDNDKFGDFLNFLDSKGLVVATEHRVPRWWLLASYG